MDQGIKIRYNKQQFEKLKKKAKKSGLSIPEYQKLISKKAKVEISLDDE